MDGRGIISKVPVDLKLAHTYLPALICLCKGSALILLISRQWVSQNVPVLIILCILLYMDRVVRDENIFDSNALLSTILVSHAINMFRMDSHSHSFFFAQRIQKQIVSSSPNPSFPDVASGAQDNINNYNSSLLISNPSVQLPPNHLDTVILVTTTPWGAVAHVIYWIVSILLIFDIDVANATVRMVYRCIISTRASGGTMNHMGYPLRHSTRCTTVVLHGVLLLSVIHTPFDPRYMTSYYIITRCYAFMILCHLWIYVIGIKQMLMLLFSSSRLPSLSHTWEKKGKNKDATHTTVVQSFLPCQLRFSVLLFIDGWYMYAVAGTMALLMGWYLYMLHENPNHCDNCKKYRHDDDGSSQHDAKCPNCAGTHPEYYTVMNSGGLCSTGVGFDDELSSVKNDHNIEAGEDNDPAFSTNNNINNVLPFMFVSHNNIKKGEDESSLPMTMLPTKLNQPFSSYSLSNRRKGPNTVSVVQSEYESNGNISFGMSDDELFKSPPAPPQQQFLSAPGMNEYVLGYTNVHPSTSNLDQGLVVGSNVAAPPPMDPHNHMSDTASVIENVNNNNDNSGNIDSMNDDSEMAAMFRKAKMYHDNNMHQGGANVYSQ